MGFLLTSMLTILALDAVPPDDEKFITVNVPEDLKDIPTGDLVTIYNRLVPSAPVKKFKDRQTAIDRTFKLMESEARSETKSEDTNDPGWNLGQEDSSTATAPDAADTSTKEDNVAATATKRGATSTRKKKGAKGSTATKGAKRGRAPGYTGAKLFRVGDENPCRDGGLRAQSWELIKPQGITFEKYLEKGGRTQELAFNVRQGRVKVEFAKGAKNGSTE